MNDATASPADAALPATTPLPFRFTGNGGEYFRIWIVNLLLSLVTLGIYSAWAKVRRERYFYGHTRVGDASFDYLASPVAILKGRLIAFAAFAVYAVAGHYLPLLQPAFFLLFMLLLPWLVVRSLQFRARNSAWRSVRFNFTGTHNDAFRLYVLWPILIIFTLGLIIPYIIFRQKQFLVANSRYGTSPFTFHASKGDFYEIYIVAFGILVGGFVLMIGGSMLTPVLGLVLGVGMYLLLFAYVSAQTSNRVFNSSRLEGHGFRSTLNHYELMMIYLTNFIGIALTFGLFIPWARVRLAHYRAEHLQLLAAGDLNHFIASTTERVNSAGEEMGEMFDVDIGL